MEPPLARTDTGKNSNNHRRSHTAQVVSSPEIELRVSKKSTDSEDASLKQTQAIGQIETTDDEILAKKHKKRDSLKIQTSEPKLRESEMTRLPFKQSLTLAKDYQLADDTSDFSFQKFPNRSSAHANQPIILTHSGAFPVSPT